MPLKETLGMISQGLGIAGQVGQMLGIGQKKQDRRQLKQQEKLNQQQIEGQKQMADYQQQLQMKTWDATNYSRQIQEMEEAGLNPAMIYGHSGGGGATVGTGTGGGPTGGQAANAAATQQANTQAMQGMALMGAQIDLMKAQAENQRADAAAKGGYQKDLATAQTGEAISRTEINKLEAELRGKSMEDQLTIIEYTGEKLLGERDEAWAKGNIAQATIKEQIKIINQELTNKAIEAVATQSNINLNEAKINEISNSIQQKWQELTIKETTSRWEHKDRIKAIEEYTRAALIGAGINAAGHLVGDIVGIATRKLPTGTQTITRKFGNETISKTTPNK